MNWPQITYICLLVFSLTVHAVKHGDPKPNYNFWAALLDAIVLVAILWAGGFWA